MEIISLQQFFIAVMMIGQDGVLSRNTIALYPNSWEKQFTLT
jgi:hypothetical protein